MDKIRNIETFLYHSEDGNEFLLIRLETENGTVGAGEASLEGRNAEVKAYIDGKLAPFLTGRELPVSNLLEASFFPKDAPEDTVARHAVSGAEIAAVDAFGKLCTLPAYRLLGGKGYPVLPVSGSSAQEPVSVRRIGIRPGKYASEMLRPFLLAAREAGDPVIAGISAAMPKKDLSALLRMLEQAEPFYVSGALSEENRADWKKLSQAARVPLSVFIPSRHEALPDIEEPAMSVVEADVLSVGGMWGLKLLASLLETYYLKIAAVCSGGELAAAAAAHVLATCPNLLCAAAPEKSYRELLLSGPGFLPGEQPGLGVEIDWKKLGKA